MLPNVSLVRVLIKTRALIQGECLGTQEVDVGGVCERAMGSV